MDILTVDFETYYDRDYSLSKMTTEEYIRDPRFETIGVSVKKNDEPGRWFSGDFGETKLFLLRYDWENSYAIAHHAAFDMGILNMIFGIKPKMIGCTLSMARAIDGPDAGNSLAKLAERYGLPPKGDDVVKAMGMRRTQFGPGWLAKYGDYCVHDGWLCYELFGKFAPLIPKSEAQLIDLTIRMFSEPRLELDAAMLADHWREVTSQKQALLASAAVDKDILMSNPKLADLLMQHNVFPPQKISKTTGGITWAFAKSDPAFVDLLDHEDPKVQAIVAARLGVKSTLEETRTQRLYDIAQRGTLPVPIRYYAAHTGRFGGEDKINLQNLPRKSVLKEAILAPEGWTLIDCDSSQIEARILAWLAGQNDLVQIFEKNNEEIARGVPKEEMLFDPYKIMASSIYGRAVRDISEDQRFVGKWTILGCGYSMGGGQFQMQLKAQGINLSADDCQTIINVYRRRYRNIVNLWTQGSRALQAIMLGRTAKLGEHGVLTVNLMGIRLPNSMYIRYPNLRTDPQFAEFEGLIYDTKRGRTAVPTRIYGGKVIENVTQALARIVVGEQMIRIKQRLPVVLTVHDSVGALAPDEIAPKARAFMERCMRTRPAWAPDLPLNCESKMGKRYG